MKGLATFCALAFGLLPATAFAQAAQTAQAAQATSDGATVYRQRCQVCHGSAKAKPSPLGPSLSGVVGRTAASTPFAYSAALKASKLVWTRDNLDKYLAGPSKLVPGTRMAMSVPDAAQRSAVVSFLAKTR